MAPYVSKKEAIDLSVNNEESNSSNIEQVCKWTPHGQVSKRNEANFCSILEACSHPKYLTHLYIDVSCIIRKRNKNCNEIEFQQ